MSAGFGVWGKEAWIKEFWKVLDWKKISKTYDHIHENRGL
jgi:Fe-Mn family superoxide dismutase